MFVFIVELLNLLFMFLFYRQFRLCITKAHRAKPIPLVGRCLGAAVA